ncbi:hypothetical protein SAMN04488524_0413 [Pedobacter africanus]|uniref:HTH cro/C1-type domain-containing protein n=2 Tax=Pedobacter africanus TaxID=151894 RepID=A0A1W1Z733_9SPHI|nr:hypothetical protein SAMN04488524_0413 [Pedobacter africanus]
MKMTIGEKMARLREQAGKTAEELADYMKMNVETYVKMEDDFIYPNDNQITRLGKFYGMSYQEVLDVGEE